MYKQTNTSSITRITDGASIPADPDNSDYADYLKWLKEGNIPEPVPKPELPTPVQLLAQLDAENALTPRNVRQVIMLFNEAIKQLSTGTLDLSQIPGVAKVYEIESKAEVIRAQL